MGKPARKTAFPFIPKRGHCNKIYKAEKENSEI